jgi:hypothetical protein
MPEVKKGWRLKTEERKLKGKKTGDKTFRKKENVKPYTRHLKANRN